MACENTVIRVKQGRLRGIIEKTSYGDEYLAFRGIPYAKPPLGPLRFKDPEPAEPWTDVRNASKYSDICVQKDMFQHQLRGSEDCLYLNVYKPITHQAPRMSVMVWIHGGAFIEGSGDDEVYGPEYFMRKDVVLVAINYRLGVLGFLNLEHEVATGNQGLKDQVMALKWVQENISSFDGDPNNVTIFGESAGGASVHYLTISPLSQGLFHKAIIQSGAALCPWASIKEPSKYAFLLAAELGESSTDPETVVEFLRTIDVQKLVATERKLLTPQERYVLYTTFGPGIDAKSPNPFIPQHPVEMSKAGVKVPLLVGFNANEGSFFLNSTGQYSCGSAEAIRNVNENFELAIPEQTKAYLKKEGISSSDLKRLYFGNESIGEKTMQKYADYLTDIMFIKAIHHIVNIQMKNSTHPTYFYKLSYETNEPLIRMLFNITLPGTTHAEDLQYLFYSKLAKSAGIKEYEVGSEDFRIMEYLTQMWTDFAKTGNPTPKITELIPTIWQPITEGNEYIYLNIDKTLRMESSSKEELRHKWKKINNKL
ncbi:juvenile hormone esterase-like [Frieseomelitta varia]|uniref:juvenile hormone esterase-like n=1 Tax=Frieseomelitta varia TaxID=561572 RepID=UPI001CB69FE6|nr:juvenile hormone esterase-like [Frieseomelitta varia]